MFCNNCGTEYEVTQIDNGKKRFCRSCGSLLYKSQDGKLIDSGGKSIFNEKIDINTGKLNIEQEHQALLEQERILKERQQQLLREKKAIELKEQQERERIEQERLQKEREARRIQEEQERQRQEAERAEREKALQLQREQEEKERKLREQIEKEIREKLQREQEERERLERELKERMERERIERELKQAAEKEKAALEKEAEEKRKAAIAEQEVANVPSLQTEEVNQPSSGTIKKFMLYVLLPLLVVTILAATTYLLFPEKIKTVLGMPANTVEAAETITADSNPDSNAAMTEQLKTALTGKEVMSWGPIKTDEVKELSILNRQEANGNNDYTVEVNLDDNSGTKAAAELAITFSNNTITSATTNKISYKNTAPANAWFSFAPLKDCDIFVNTNGNPIKLKGCENCPSVSLNTTADHPEQLLNHPETIFIQSGSETEAVVDFTYVPLK